MTTGKLLEVGRRSYYDAVQLLSGCGTWYSEWLEKRDQRLATRVFLRMSSTSAPASVAARFVRAQNAELLASYAVFFPEFLARAGKEAVAEIRRAAAEEKLRYDQDHHRLDALPAVAAVHLLSTRLGEEKAELSLEISAALSDPRREVKEIVLQNMVEAASPDFDTARFFSTDAPTLRAIDDLIREARGNDKLLSPLCMCVEFLLNLRALLASSEHNTVAVDKRLRAIKQTSAAKCPHFVYASRLIDLHLECFPRADTSDPLSLPPHRTEALLGWGRFRPRQRPYLEHLALIQTRLIFSAVQTAEGTSDAARTTMNQAHALRALPKLLALFKYFNNEQLLPAHPADIGLPRAEEKFQRFLTSELAYVLRRSDELRAFKPSADDIRLKQCVPFVRYKPEWLVTRVAQAPGAQVRGLFCIALLGGGGALIGSVPEHVAGHAVYAWTTTAWGPQRTEHGPGRDELRELLEKAVRAGSQRCEAEAVLDEKQNKLGPALVPAPAGPLPEMHMPSAAMRPPRQTDRHSTVIKSNIRKSQKS